MGLARDIKLTLVGNTGAGKTALLRRIAKIDNNTLVSEPSTIGAALSKVSYPLGKCRINYQLWDTGGRFIYRSLLQIYVRGSNVALICFNTRNPDFEAELTALQDIISKLEGSLDLSKSILVFTQCDSEDKKNPENKLTDDQKLMVLDKLEGISGEVNFSARGNQGFDDLKQAIETVVLKTYPELANTSTVSTEAPNTSTPVVTPKQAIGLAIAEIEKGSVLLTEETKTEGYEFKAWLEQLEKTIDSYKPKDREKLAKYVLNLSKLVANKSPKLKAAIPEFHRDTQKLNLGSKLGEIIGGLIGAAIGVLVGAMAGVKLGPGAAVTALIAGEECAKIGATVGAGVLGAAGAWCTHWYKKRNDPIHNLEVSALRVLKATA